MLVFYNGTEVEGRAIYKAFLDIGSSHILVVIGSFTYVLFAGPVADMTKEIPYENLNTLSVRCRPFQSWPKSDHL